MKKDSQEKFFDAFPNLYKERVLPMTQTCMCWGLEVGDGWFELLWNLSEKLEPYCKNNENYCAEQVKSKFGTLRFYASANDEMREYIRSAEKLSASICEFCGKNAKLYIKNRWLYTACEKCALEKDMTKYNADDDSE